MVVPKEHSQGHLTDVLLMLFVLGPWSSAAGDWLQGPYVYHLYEHYGFPVRDIGRLFIMGFGSSAVFGTLAGIMADRR